MRALLAFAAALPVPLSPRAPPLCAVQRRAPQRACASNPSGGDAAGADGRSAAATGASPSAASQTGARRSGDGFEITHEQRIFHRYQTVWARTVRYPSGQHVSFDVLGNARSDFTSVFVFPFRTRTRRATVLTEYAPGRNAETPSFVAGMFERDKHASLEHAARAELSEEAGLAGGELVKLCGPVAADKYSRNEFHYFLALDCAADDNPLPKDAEEWISSVRDVCLDDVRGLVRDGALNTPNSLLAVLALERLREMGFE